MSRTLPTAPHDALTGSVASTATPTPTPSAPDPDSVTPGLLGFLVVFLLAIVTWLLLRNMTARLRRMRYREAQRIEAEEARGERPGPDDEPPVR